MIYPKKNERSTSPSPLTVDRKGITHPQDMAQQLNNFFTSVGKEIQNNISSAISKISKEIKIFLNKNSKIL